MLDWRWMLEEALLETWREMVAACFGLFAHNLRGAGFAIAAMIGMAVAAARLAASTCSFCSASVCIWPSKTA